MKTKLTTILVALVVVLPAARAIGQVGYTGVVSVDSVQVNPGESFSINVWLRNNNVDISAMAVPLRFSNPHLVLDSVSLLGSIWGPDFAGYYVIDNVEQTVRITVLPEEIEYPLPSLSVVDGVVARLHFTLSGSATPGSSTIDSIYTDTIVYDDIHVFTRIDVSDNTGNGVYLPGFIPGEVEVLMPTAVDDEPGNSPLPNGFELTQNYPNPFNPATNITFSLPAAGHVGLDVYNILGQRLVTLVDRPMEAGVHQLEFDGAHLPSGIYFYRLVQGERTSTKKMILLK